MRLERLGNGMSSLLSGLLIGVFLGASASSYGVISSIGIEVGLSSKTASLLRGIEFSFVKGDKGSDLFSREIGATSLNETEVSRPSL